MGIDIGNVTLINFEVGGKMPSLLIKANSFAIGRDFLYARQKLIPISFLQAKIQSHAA
ncbi:hypothetical protein D3C77_625600 [compost metagenome]